MKITIAHLYPDMLNLYGDSGNIAVLKHRLEARGIDADVKTYAIDDDIDFENTDIIFIGGGGEREQLAVAKRLNELSDEMKTYAENGGVILAVCGGFEVLGKYYKTYDSTVECAGVLDIATEYSDKKIVGNAVIKSDILGTTIVGFENHSGKTYIGENSTPFGMVIRGFGNNGEDKKEGIIFKNIIGTNLHGPLLPKNPEIADLIIERALERKHGEKITLEPLNDTIAEYAKSYVLDITKGQ